MIKMDELITNISDDEAIELDGFMDEKQQRRIEDRILSAIMEEEFAGEREKSEKIKVPHRLKRRNRKRFLILGLAAILLLGLGLTALGASMPDWDITLIRAMGLSKTETLQLESGEVEINETVSYDCEKYLGGKTQITPVEVTAQSSIGDKNSAFIRFTTDYKLPEGFDETTDYISPENCEIRVYKKDPAKEPMVTDMGMTFYSISENGYLGFIGEVVDCNDLNKSYVTVHLEDMYLYRKTDQDGQEEETKELLLKGSWDLKWKYEYKSNVKTYRMLEFVPIKEEHCYINKIEISPISVTVWGFRMPWNRKLPQNPEGLTPELIYYKDGTVKSVGDCQVTGCKNSMFYECFVGIQSLEEPIDTKKVTAVMIGGQKIKLR